MPSQLTDITEVDIAGGSTVYNLETAINALIGQRIVDATSDQDGLLKLITFDGDEVTLALPYFFPGVATGLGVTRNAAMDYEVAIGSYQVNGMLKTTTGVKALTLAAADATDPRIDTITGNADTGQGDEGIQVITGVPGANPAFPSVPSDRCVIGTLWIPPIPDAGKDLLLSFNSIGGVYTGMLTFQSGRVLFENFTVESRRPPKTDYDTLSASGAVDPDVPMHLVDSSGGAITLDLPADVTNYDGFSWVYQDMGDATGNPWIINGNGIDINDAADYTVSVDHKRVVVTVMGGKYYVG